MPGIRKDPDWLEWTGFRGGRCDCRRARSARRGVGQRALWRVAGRSHAHAAHPAVLSTARGSRGEAGSRRAGSTTASSCRPSATSRAHSAISRTTVVSAYRELEARGLVRGYVGRGTFVCARPDPGSAPFAWRGKVSAAALQSSRHDGARSRARRREPAPPLVRRRPARARAVSDDGISRRDRVDPHARRHRAMASRRRPKASRASARPSASDSAAPRTTCWSSRARSRASICSRDVSSIPATRSSSIVPATSARSTASAARARGSSAGTSFEPTRASSRSCCCGTAPSSSISTRRIRIRRA